jgi:hypothetical protein
MTSSDCCGGGLALERLSRGSIERIFMRRWGQVVSEESLNERQTLSFLSVGWFSPVVVDCEKDQFRLFYFLWVKLKYCS